MDAYQELLNKKITSAIASGFEVDESQRPLNAHLFPFQAHIVKRALSTGCFAIFADCGLGKTLMQLCYADEVVYHTTRPVIILTPLAVAAQTVEEARKFGIEGVIRWMPEMAQNAYLPDNIYVAHYEQLESLPVDEFVGVVLDESSILKNFTGATKRALMEAFAQTPYKLCCTATPSPNDLNEIGNHAEFLNVLDAQDMRAKWFVRDEGMNNYRLKGHAKVDFYGWIASWSIMLASPADIGFDGAGYVLPKLIYTERQITTPSREGAKLFNDVAVNATNFNSELRLTKLERLTEVAGIVNGSTEPFIIWVKQNEEEDELLKLIPDAVAVRGSMSPELKESRLLGFARGQFRVLVTKAKIAQFGLNFQHCPNQVFASLDFSFEGLYQAIRRSYRFGQTKCVHIYLITTDTMQNVISSIKQKQAQFDEMRTEVVRQMNGEKYGLLTDYTYRELRTESAWLMKGDSCKELSRIPDNSVDLIIYSPPFSSLFTYSNYIHDMGNNADHNGFFEQYAFLLKELYRVLKPGRLMCCHTKDLGVYKNSSGYTGMYDFTAEHTRAVQDGGFKLHSKVTIWCDPVLEMQRTKTQRLLYKTLTTDSSYTGIGMAEYITVFRKWEGDETSWEPVTHLNRTNMPLDTWQKWASPVWMDIKRTDVLNGKEGTAMGDEKHIAPLQLEVIHRLVNLWSNPGETVLTPFGGIGSEPYMSIKNGRKAIACELKDSYFDVMCSNVRKAEQNQLQLSIFH